MVQRVRPGDSGKVRVAQLQLHGARVQADARAAAAPTISDSCASVASSTSASAVSSPKGVFVADGFRVAVLADFAIEPAARIQPARLAGQRQAPFPEALAQKRLLECAPDRRPCGSRSRAGSSPSPCRRPGSCAHRAAPESALPGPAAPTECRSAWPDRRRSSRPCATSRCRWNSSDRSRGCTRFMQRVRRPQRRPVQPLRAGHIQIGFIDRSHLHPRRKTVQHFEHFAGIFAVALADGRRRRSPAGTSW